MNNIGCDLCDEIFLYLFCTVRKDSKKDTVALIKDVIDSNVTKFMEILSPENAAIFKNAFDFDNYYFKGGFCSNTLLSACGCSNYIIEKSELVRFRKLHIIEGLKRMHYAYKHNTYDMEYIIREIQILRFALYILNLA